MKRVGFLGLALLAGCQSGKFADPNEPAALVQTPEQMMRTLQDTRERLDRRVAKRQISPTDRDQLMLDLNLKYLNVMNPAEVEPTSLWAAGDLYRDAGQWRKAYEIYDAARKAAKTEDRRVNDQLRFARAAAVLGKIDEALAAARSTFTAPPVEKAPILPAILYEVVPAAEGKKKDVELAKLLEEAIKQHQQTVVDPKTEAGRSFIMVRPSHIQRAFSKMIELYSGAGRRDLAREAVRRSDQSSSRYGSV